MSYRAIQVGTGGQGARWCDTFLQPHVEAGRVDVVAAVDVDESAHTNAREHLGVPESACYTDVEDAFAEHDADFCTVVVPPWVHEEVVDAALAYDLDILSEKPIADTLDASVRIAEKVERAGAKMGVTMSHRFDRDKTTLRRQIRAESERPAGLPRRPVLPATRVRTAPGARSVTTWTTRCWSTAPSTSSISLADMAGAPCERLYADTWQPEWAEYAGDVQATVQLRFANGVRATWEGAKANAATLNGWGSDYVRAECRDATLELDDRELTRYPYEADAEGVVGTTGRERGEAVPSTNASTGRTPGWSGSSSTGWTGGDPMATNVDDNLQSVALVAAAIESSETDQPVAVQELLADARAAVDV